MAMDVLLLSASLFPFVKWALEFPSSQVIILSYPLYLALWSGQGRAGQGSFLSLLPPPLCSRRFGRANCYLLGLKLLATPVWSKQPGPSLGLRKPEDH